MPTRSLFPEGVDMRRCASKDAGSQRGVDLVGVLHRLEKGTIASEDAGPCSRVDTRVCASKDVGPEGGVDLVGVLHRLEKGTSVSEDAGPCSKVDTRRCASKDAGPWTLKVVGYTPEFGSLYRDYNH